MRLHIAVDMDDVMNEFVRHLYACFKTEFGITLPYDGNPWGPDAVAFRDGTNHTIWQECGWDDWWGWLRARDWLWGIPPAVEGAVGSITMLRNKGHRVEALTKKPDWAMFTVWKWMADWRPPFHTVTIVPSSEPKHEWSSADVLIDDSWENCRAWCASSPERYAVVFGAHHEMSHLGPRMYMTTGWAGAMASLELIEKELEAIASGD